MIIGRDLMVQMVLMAEFNHQVLQWYGATVHMKETSSLLGQSDLNKREMRKVVMQAAETASTLESTERTVKTLDSTYTNSELKQVAYNTTQMNFKLKTLLLSLLEGFEDLFDGTLGDWFTEPVDLETNPDSEPFNIRYYPVPRIKK